MPTDVSHPRIAILGGGITGLAAAHRLTELAPACEWRLFEASDRPGGVLQTVEEGPWRVELSADNFLTRDPWALDLCRRVGLDDELLPTNRERRGAQVIHRGRPVPVPKGFVLMSARPIWPTLSSPLLSVRAKVRLLAEPFIARGRRNGETDESVAGFARRRLGGEVLDRLVQPLVGGIYTADPERLSMAATLPQFLEQETDHGSLWQGSRQKRRGPDPQQSGANYALFMAPRLGMQQLVDAVVARLPAERIALNRPINELAKTADNRWRVSSAGGTDEYDAVLLATPAFAAAKLLRTAAPTLAEALARIEYATSAVVCLGVRDEQITRPIDAFGFVVPTGEGRRIIAGSFSSYKFPGRAPAGHTLIRVFVGGAMQPDLAGLPDDELTQLVREELSDLIGLRGAPELTKIVRWRQAMPQYHVGHLDRVAQIESLAEAAGGLVLAGAGYRGVGVPQCVHAGERAAERSLQANQPA